MLEKSVIAYLKQIGYLKEDLPQIEECFHKCKFDYSVMPKKCEEMSMEDFDKLEEERCSRRKALDTLGWQEFWSGIGRTAFHASTSRFAGKVRIGFEWKFWRD